MYLRRKAAMRASIDRCRKRVHASPLKVLETISSRMRRVVLFSQNHAVYGQYQHGPLTLVKRRPENQPRFNLVGLMALSERYGESGSRDI
jgi:hypothetical protein